MLYKHKHTGQFLRLIKKRKSDINTYLIVDEGNRPIILKVDYCTHPCKQIVLVRGFLNLNKV